MGGGGGVLEGQIGMGEGVREVVGRGRGARETCS